MIILKIFEIHTLLKLESWLWNKFIFLEHLVQLDQKLSCNHMVLFSHCIALWSYPVKAVDAKELASTMNVLIIKIKCLNLDKITASSLFSSQVLLLSGVSWDTNWQKMPLFHLMQLAKKCEYFFYFLLKNVMTSPFLSMMHRLHERRRQFSPFSHEGK